MKRLVLAIAFALALAPGTLMTGAAPVSAQPGCSDALAWPSFAEVVPTARSIILVKVSKSVEGIAEKARVVEVMKGSSSGGSDLRRLQPGRTSDCPAPIGPYAQVGDRLLIAYDGIAPGRAGSIDAIAHVGRMRDRRNLSGLERLTLDEARAWDAHGPDRTDREEPTAPPQSDTVTDIIRRAIPQPIAGVIRDILDGVLSSRTPAPTPGRPSPSTPTEPTTVGFTDAVWSCGGDPPGFPRSALTGPMGVETMDGAVFDGLRSALETMRPEFEYERREDRPHQLPWLLAYQDQDLALFLVKRTGGWPRSSSS